MPDRPAAYSLINFNSTNSKTLLISKQFEDSLWSLSWKLVFYETSRMILSELLNNLFPYMKLNTKRRYGTKKKIQKNYTKKKDNNLF